VFEWDAQKAAANQAKHGVSFEEAATVFGDPSGVDAPDLAHSIFEARRLRYGTSTNGRILTVAYTPRRSSDGKETIRIISARPASRRERATTRQPD